MQRDAETHAQSNAFARRQRGEKQKRANESGAIRLVPVLALAVEHVEHEGRALIRGLASSGSNVQSLFDHLVRLDCPFASRRASGRSGQGHILERPRERAERGNGDVRADANLLLRLIIDVAPRARPRAARSRSFAHHSLFVAASLAPRRAAAARRALKHLRILPPLALVHPSTRVRT